MNLLIALALLTAQEGQPNKRDPNLPTACEIRAYYLDKDGHPAEAKDVKATVVFEAPDGKTRTYPMTWTPYKEDDKNPGACRQYSINGTDYRFAVCANYSDASTPGGNTHYDKPFLKDLPVPIEPDRQRGEERKNDAFAKSGYYRAYLSKHEIDEIADGPYTDVSVLFTIRGDQRKTKCFTCREGVPVAPTARVSDDLKTLEKQIEAGDWDKAKATMAQVRRNVEAMPSSPADNRAKDDCVSTCKDLDAAVSAEKKDKALKELHKLQGKCEACDAHPSESKPKK